MKIDNTIENVKVIEIEGRSKVEDTSASSSE
jgi:hypothetical protein